jgi:hypothetical protein
MIALLAMAALIVPSSPAEAERYYGSWSSTCDTGLLCEVNSSLGHPANPLVRISVLREAGPGAKVRISVSNLDGSPPGPHSIVIDDHGYGLVEHTPSVWGVLPGHDLAVARALAKARKVYVVDGPKRYPIFPDGTAAALRDMDARQGRAGTVTAIVARGAGPASLVPAPPPLPVRFEARRPRHGLVIRPRQQLVAAWRRAAECDPELDPPTNPPQSWPVDHRSAVILVPCWLGGHNSYYLVKVGTRADGSDARDAEFDFHAAITERSGPTAPPGNPGRDERTGRLVSGQHGGLAYPSTYEEWVWDGQRFRIVEGSTSYGSTFRARVRQR